MATAKKTPGTAVATKKSANIVDIKSIQEKLRQQAADMNSRVAPASGITIQVKQNKEFVFPDGTKADRFEGVIVDFVSANFFYEGAYDPKNITPPACFAIGQNPLALVPSANSPIKQADECKGCPMNEFGSAGDGKACKNSRVLAVLPPDADEKTPIWLLKVSPTALKAFDAYVRTIAATMQMPPVSVITEFYFDEKTDYPSLRFGEPKPNEQLGVHYARQEEAQKLLNEEPDVSQFQATQKKPAAKKTAGARR